MRSALDLRSNHPVLEEIRQADRQGDLEALDDLIERFKSTPADLRVDGIDILCGLLSTTFGMARFIQDATWREVITIEELNHPDRFDRNALAIIARADRDKDYGKSKSVNLNSELFGEQKKLIDSDAAFRQKITAEGFCYGGRKSAAYQYLVYPEYIKIITNHRVLWSKISIDFLNEIERASDFSTILPVMFELSRYQEGVIFLSLVPDLIRQDGLNAGNVYTGSLKHISLFPEGVDLLHNPSVRKKIESRTLNKIDKRDMSSVVSVLAKTSRGCELLSYPDIVKKVEEHTFTVNYGHNMSAVFHMAKQLIGLQVIARHQRYRGFIQAYDMNFLCHSGENAGTSLLFWLLARKEGCDLLLNSRELRRLVDTSILLSKAEGGEFKGLSALDFLMMPENQKLLGMLSAEVRRFVQEHRNVPMQEMLLSRSRSGLFLHVNEITAQAEDVAKKSEVPAMPPVEVPGQSEEPRARRFGCTIL
jgi:hypothetical protein